ncbi:MAG: succinate--CoA ligase subunit alpha [Vulcanimicrobiaceae bacterium]
MAILLDRNSKVVVQGVTGREGLFHTQRMLAYGTNVVGGVTPGKGGSVVADGLPVFDTVKDAVDATGATHSVIFVPPLFATDALLEAYDAKIALAICITEGIPVHDMFRVAAATATMRIVGPNCPGVVTPGEALIGIMPGHIFKPGRIGVISRSGTLTYEIVDALSKAGLGQSTCVGIGGDPIIGTTFVDCLRLFARDTGTDAVVVCGEIGGSDEEDAAAFVAEHMRDKPVVAFIGGRSAPAGKRLGHAGAIISGSTGTPASKLAAFAAAGVPVADRTSEIPALLQRALERGGARHAAAGALSR